MTLEREMRRICFELNWLAQGKVASYNSDGGGSPPSSRSPGKYVERDHAPGDYWWRRFLQAVGHLKEQVRDEARTERDNLKRRRIVEIEGETDSDLASRVVSEGQGWTLQEIAFHCRCTPTFARNARRSAGCSVETGIPETSHPTDEATYAQDLAAKGMSRRGIQMALKCGSKKLQRLLAA